MLNLREEIQGIARARDERRALMLLCDALTSAVVPATLDDVSRDRLFEAATQHGVLGLFPLAHPQFAAAVMAGRARNLRALKFTHRVVHAIEAEGIPVVVLKGAVAASRWSDPTLRQQSDVDVLVEKRHQDAAAKALIAAGVRPRFLESEHMHNDSLQPAEPSGLLVEVHHYFNNHHENRVDVAELLARRTRVKTAQGPLPALSAEDDAVFLALHATTHALQRLAWLVDLAALKVDWREATLRAQQWNVWLPVRLACGTNPRAARSAHSRARRHSRSTPLRADAAARWRRLGRSAPPVLRARPSIGRRPVHRAAVGLAPETARAERRARRLRLTGESPRVGGC
ncbi:MAG: nucleotidyltransferase family protein [Archangiaceae bacterium]|nr:nucleotidyltransferase family protein [Archangiaceae bacterium]